MVEEGAQRPSRNPLTTGNTRVKEARKLSRRSVRAERRLFLADGPKAVEGALSVDGCVVEVFATEAATDAVRRPGRGGADLDPGRGPGPGVAE